MSNGTRWITPTGHPAMELAGSTHDMLHLRWSQPGWPFPKTQFVPRSLCVKDTSPQATATESAAADHEQLMLRFGPAAF